MPLLVGMSILLGCQLLGEIISQMFHLPIPGPVIGMVILLISLMIYGRVPEGLRVTTNGLTQHLAFFFVPAGVGVMANWPLISQNLLDIIIVLFVSTLGLQAFMVFFMKKSLKAKLQNHDEDPIFKDKQS